MMDKCPHCGSDEGVTTYSYATGVVPYMIDWPGKKRECNHKGELLCDHHNEQMHDALRYKERKYATCLTCKKRVKVEDMNDTD